MHTLEPTTKKTAVVWMLLVALTIHAWTLSIYAGPESTAHAPASVAILILAFVKARLVGTYFMELRKAPTVLRMLFDTWCGGVCLITVCLLLMGCQSG